MVNVRDPLIGHAGLLVSSTALSRHPAPALFVIGAVALPLLFIGIHNAWAP